MKIVYLIPGCGVSGGIAVICQHANRLLARGFEVYLVSQSNENSIDWFPGLKVPVLSLEDYPYNVDCLIATGWSTSFQVAILSANKKFYFVQSDETRFHPKGSEWEHITRLSYLFEFSFITEARWIKSWLKQNFGKEATLIPNGLDEKIFYPAKPLVPKGTKARVLLEGAIGLPYKGMKEAFQALAPLDVEVWCVSSYGKPQADWKCDRFFEQIPMSDMKYIYSSCDVLLKLSQVEGFFGPPMEMMACGGAVVVGRVTGYDEYIVDGENALVVDPLDISAATNAVQRIISDNSLKVELIKKGRETAALWQWNQSIDKLESCFTSSLNEEIGGSLVSNQAALNESISYFYRLLYSTPQQVREQATGSTVIDTPEDRLCRRLKGMFIFKKVAIISERVYLNFRRIWVKKVNGVRSLIYEINRKISS